MKKTLLIALIAWQANIYANNLQLSDLQLNEGVLSFYISWENSWNLEESPGNHDAVWIFFKVQQENTWFHRDVPGNEAAYSFSQNQLEVFVPEDKKGFFVKRRDIGTGHIENIKVAFSFSENISEIQNIRIYGIEMVFIPEGSFHFGDAVSYNSIHNENKSVWIANENEIDIQSMRISCREDSVLPDLLPEAYPKGYAGFYCMKYEISQEQYCDFLNTLSVDQQMALTENAPFQNRGVYAMVDDGRNRNAIIISQTASENNAIYALELHVDGNYSSHDDGANIAMNWLQWSDLAAYLDWAALRPMTEMEFEKVCRGADNEAVPGEFAWGTPYIKDANTLENSGTETEIVSEHGNDSTGLANHGYEGIQGPLRCGFAAMSQTSRIPAGATYYGAMEMSGNLWEIVITVSESGAQFTGYHGNGTIDASGFADVSAWPDNHTSEGSGYKGGGWNSGIYEIGSFRDLAVSDRFYINLNASIRRNTAGGRGVRTFKMVK